MAYDEQLADQIRAVLAGRPGIVAKKMFGGLCFMLNGNMAVGVLKDELLVRMTADQGDTLLTEPHVRRADMAGRPMRGWLVVSPPGFAATADLERWIAHGIAVAESLPSK